MGSDFSSCFVLIYIDSSSRFLLGNHWHYSNTNQGFFQSLVVCSIIKTDGFLRKCNAWAPLLTSLRFGIAMVYQIFCRNVTLVERKFPLRPASKKILASGPQVSKIFIHEWPEKIFFYGISNFFNTCKCICL